MPKERKRGAKTGGATRHAPLGQVMTDDANKSKYATVKSRDKKSSGKKDKYVDGDLLNEKETRRIFELSKEQMLEVEIEEQQQVEKNRRGDRKNVDEDSSDEEDNGSTMGDILQDGTDE